MMSPSSRCGISWSIKSSTGLPALTISITRRGRLSAPASSSIECVPTILRPLALAVDKLVHAGQGAVVHGHGKAVVLHIQNQVLAHDGQADQTNICFDILILL